MNEDLIRDANASYQLAEKKADQYFKSLYTNVMQKDYIPNMTKDIKWWRQKHTHHSLLPFVLRGKSKIKSKDYREYIKWLDNRGKLDSYLDRSVSYIFMRDLGKTLDSPDTQKRVEEVAKRLKDNLTSVNLDNKIKKDDMSWLYQKAKDEDIEPTIMWLTNKLKTVADNIPKGMDAERAQEKLAKVIIGVTINALDGTEKDMPAKDRSKKLDEAIRLGYSYGITYPFVDDILDSNILSDKEKKQYSDLIRTALITGNVPELGEWDENNMNVVRYAHSELKEAFEYIKSHQSPETMKSFLNQSYVFFNAQEVDREKDLSNPNYTNEELYIPSILKSASSRLIIRSVIGAPEDKDFDNRTFYYGIYNQMVDDFGDLFDDMKDGTVTPFTYYMKHHDKRSDLVNPFELYWTVIANLVHNVYNSDPKTCEVILARTINSLKRFKEQIGNEKYKEVMGVFAPENSKFNKLVKTVTQKADDVDFFDKLVRDNVVEVLKNERKGQEDFFKTIKNVRNEINDFLKIPKDESASIDDGLMIDASNYSLECGGKRLRPIMTWVMGVNAYGLNKSAIIPLLKSLEYMHTASLIFDDLPSQDNASTRRGQQTLHEVYNHATAELAGLFLMQKAVEEQATLDQFDPKNVLKVIQYSSQTVQNLCKGQAVDLGSKGKQLTLEQLNSMCFYKTGIAFEASLVMPAILADAKESEIKALKEFSYHAGIAFQIKDDLLDVEGDSTLLGKSTGKDSQNNSSTFVSILGQEGAKKVMLEHYCLALQALQDVPHNTSFLRNLLNYIVNREN